MSPSSFARAVALAAALVAGAPAASTAEDLTLLAHPASVASAHPPLIVLMHGAGADEKDMIGLWRQLPPQFVVVSPRGPFGGNGGYRWYRKGATQDADIALSRKIVDLVVDNAVKRFDADPAQVFVGGFSQGGVMTYEVALHEPGRFRGAVVLSGLLFPSAIGGDPPGRNATPFFIAHGTADPVIPFAAAASARDTLEKRGLAVTFEALPGVGHATPDAEIAALKTWLEQRLAKSSP